MIVELTESNNSDTTFVFTRYRYRTVRLGRNKMATSIGVLPKSLSISPPIRKYPRKYTTQIHCCFTMYISSDLIIPSYANF